MLILRILVFLAPFLFLTTSCLAATLTVTSTADTGPGSLREALALAGDADRIEFSVTGTIALTSGQLVIDDSVTITGPGLASLAISGNDSSRVIEVSPGEEVAISDLTISSGRIDVPLGLCCSGEGGSGICNRGTVTLTDVNISNNLAGGGVPPGSAMKAS